MSTASVRMSRSRHCGMDGRWCGAYYQVNGARSYPRRTNQLIHMPFEIGSGAVPRYMPSHDIKHDH